MKGEGANFESRTGRHLALLRPCQPAKVDGQHLQLESFKILPHSVTFGIQTLKRCLCPSGHGAGLNLVCGIALCGLEWCWYWLVGVRMCCVF